MSDARRSGSHRPSAAHAGSAFVQWRSRAVLPWLMLSFVVACGRNDGDTAGGPANVSGMPPEAVPAAPGDPLAPQGSAASLATEAIPAVSASVGASAAPSSPSTTPSSATTTLIAGLPVLPSPSARAPRDPCPSGPAQPSQTSPSLVADDLSAFYEACLEDYLAQHGEFEQQVVTLSPAEQRRVLCAALADDGVTALERAQVKVVPPASAPENCLSAEKRELHLGRVIWEFSELPNGRALATRTARVGSPLGPMYQGHRISTSVDGRMVFTRVLDDAWRCPTNSDDPCASFATPDGNGGAAGDVRCFDEKTLCVRAGITSSVYVTDAESGVSLEFGPFHRRAEPVVKVREHEVQVMADECRQTAPLPITAPPKSAK